MKHCNSCDKDKDESLFGNRKASPDGLSSKCKECQSAYDKARANDPKRVKARAEYAKTPSGIEASKRAKKKWANENKGKVYEITKSYRERHPLKCKAHGMVAYAIKMKNLVRKPCEICECKKTHAHHDDYAEPLNVRWLCDKHHKEWHAKNGEGKNA